VTKPTSITQTGYGAKAMAIFAMAASSDHDLHWTDICHQFSQKSVIRKCEELAQRGYIVKGPQQSWAQSFLTDKGRQVLETITMSGS